MLSLSKQFSDANTKPAQQVLIYTHTQTHTWLDITMSECSECLSNPVRVCVSLGNQLHINKQWQQIQSRSCCGRSLCEKMGQHYE